MAKPTTTFLANITANDGANAGGSIGGVGDSSSEWLALDASADFIGWCGEEQQNGDATTGTIYPALIPASDSAEAAKTFIWDTSAVLLKQVPLAGTALGGQSGGATRYVFAMYFSGAIASLPYLECWDTAACNSTDDPVLNTSGTSLIYAIATTDAVPATSSWTGTALKGVTTRVALCSSIPTVAQNVYWNMKLVIPSTFVAETNNSLRFLVRYSYS